MFRVSREIEFCYGHRLLNYDGKCKYLHGHNGTAILTIETDRLDDRGMVVDFSDIKRIVAAWIDDNIDHRMILHREDPFVPILQRMNEPLFLLDVNPTAENIAKVIHEHAVECGLPVIETQLWETAHAYATYRGE